MDFLESDFLNLEPAEAERVKREIERYNALITEADAISGRGGVQRFVKTPLLYGISAALIFFGVILWSVRISVIGGMFFILAGLPIFAVAAVLFIKMKKTQKLYEEADRIKTSLQDIKDKSKYSIKQLDD